MTYNTKALLLLLCYSFKKKEFKVNLHLLYLFDIFQKKKKRELSNDLIKKFPLVKFIELLNIDSITLTSCFLECFSLEEIYVYITQNTVFNLTILCVRLRKHYLFTL